MDNNINRDFDNKLRRYVKEKKQFNDKNHLILSKNNLLNTIKKKLQTIMIGSLAKYEKYFGEEWGLNKKDEECGAKEDEKFDCWEKCRQEILDLGNKQIRDIEKDIDRYNIDLKGFNIKFN
jgi:hypothetical protein